MQLKVEAHFDEPISSFRDPHHAIQSIIYSSIGHVDYFSDFMHDRGYGTGKRLHKLFTFSYDDKELAEKGILRFELRSIAPIMTTSAYEGFSQRGFYIEDLQNHKFTTHSVFAKITDTAVLADRIVIRTKSPICVHSTDNNRQPTYYLHSNPEFYSRINDSFKRRYKAYYGLDPEGEIHLSALECHEKAESFMGTTDIKCTEGTFLLQGDPRHLNFLYQSGIGEKTAQGFGLFDLT